MIGHIHKRTLKVLFFFLFLTGCAEHDTQYRETGSLTIRLENLVGDQELQLNTEYVNTHGESFTVSKFAYFISNIRLKDARGDVFTIPQDSSYFLVDQGHVESMQIVLNDIPASEYREITFMIGVDSLRSTMDLSRRQGILDPAQGEEGMYWTWNSGYIFLKMEGTSPSAPAEQENKFYYHIGGYGGYDSPTLNNIRTKAILIPQGVKVESGTSAKIKIIADILQFFENPTALKIQEHPVVMFSEYSLNVSGNYVNMFSLGNVE